MKDEYFARLLPVVASASKDPSTKVGAIIVARDGSIKSTGYNGFPRKVKDTTTRWERPTKYDWVCHAEVNAVYNAARHGIPLEGSRIYVSSVPCSSCAQAIIQSGIEEVVVVEDTSAEHKARWEQSYERTKMMFTEAGVKLNFIAC